MSKELLKRLTRDDTEHGVEYYRADEVDSLLAEQPAPSQYGSPELQAMIVARAMEKNAAEQPARQQEPRIAELEETVRQLNRALREATEAPTFMGEPVQNRLTDEQALDVMGQRIGYGRIQQIAGQLWDVRHGCAPRGSMGVTVKDTTPPPQPAQKEPLAWVDERVIAWLADRHGKRSAYITTKLSAVKSFERPMAIYTAPLAQRTWVWLTDDEIVECWARPTMWATAHAIERKLKEKNT